MQHVLIVEDEQDIASILQINLEADGFKVSILNNGGDVDAFLKKHVPHIILLDVMIPQKNGFDVCKDI